MSMVTRCPSCATVFRVTPQQLQAHQGQVRCGRCLTVFDGFEGLATLLDQAQPETPLRPAADSAARSAANATTAAQTEATVMRDPAAPAPEPAAAPLLPAGFEFEPIETRAKPKVQLAAGSDMKPAAIKASAESGAAVKSTSTVSADKLFLEQAHSRQRRGSRAWAVVSALMLLTLAGQASYFYRSELAANYPDLKPALARMCELLQCSVPLPQRPKLINIEASDLQTVDPARPGVIQLTATLRNHAGYDLGYPALDLVLTNTKEHTLARRIFMPEEYLERGRDVMAGIPSSAEITIRLELETGDLGAAGFRLDLLPAPAK